MSFIYDKGITTQNLAYLSYWYRKKRLQVHFEQYSVVTQYAKLAAGEHFCRLCSHRNYSTSKLLKVPPEKLQILSCDTVVANERCL